MDGTRHEDRVQVTFPATVKAAGGTFRDVVTDVSASGFHLKAEGRRLRQGDRVRVAFSLPVAGRLVPLEVEGTVARVERDALHRTKGVGIHLSRPSPRVLQTLDGYLAQLAHGPGRTEGDDQS